MNRRGFLKTITAAALATTTLGGWGRGFIGYDVILQIGDSNSYAGLNVDGSASYDPAVDTTNPNCFERRSANRQATGPGPAFFYTVVANSVHPLDYAPPTQPVPASGINGVGSGESFVKAWQTTFAAPGRKTMIVVHGVGGTGLCNTIDTTNSPAYWQATPVVGGGLTIAINRVNLVLAASALNRLVAIIYTGWANDAIFEKTTGLPQATYENQFIGTASYLRSTIVGTGASTAPILLMPPILAFVTNPSTAAPNVAAAIANLPNLISQCGYADPTGVSDYAGQTATAFHIAANGQRWLGATGFVNAYNNRSA